MGHKCHFGLIQFPRIDVVKKMVSPNTMKQAHKNMADMPDEDGGEGDVMKEEDAGTFIMVVVAILLCDNR